jgi:hypothetical protein
MNGWKKADPEAVAMRPTPGVWYVVVEECGAFRLSWGEEVEGDPGWVITEYRNRRRELESTGWSPHRMDLAASEWRSIIECLKDILYEAPAGWDPLVAWHKGEEM